MKTLVKFLREVMTTLVMRTCLIALVVVVAQLEIFNPTLMQNLLDILLTG